MQDLIKALIIFSKYQEETNSPTHCEHDTLYVMGVTQEQVSEEDQSQLSQLGFMWSAGDDAWISFRFGSA